MNLIHKFVAWLAVPVVEAINHTVIERTKSIMATQQEAALALTAVKDQLTKIGGETSTLLTKIGELQALIDAGAVVTPELQTAIDAVTAQAKAVDDLVPDAPVPPAEPPTP